MSTPRSWLGRAGQGRGVALLLLLGVALVGSGCTMEQRLACVPVPLEAPLPDGPERLQPPGPMVEPTENQPVTETSLFAAEGSAVCTLPEAIAFALLHNPRLEQAHARLEEAGAQEQGAFAPFLPQLDLLNRYGATSANLSPGAPGFTGGILPTLLQDDHQFLQTELELQWTLYDFGLRKARYGQAVSRERMAEQQWLRARQTVAFETATTYYQVLVAKAFRRLREEAVRAAEATRKDAEARRVGGVADRDDVLRADVQLAATRDAVIGAEETERDSLARLNIVMGRPVSLPIEVVDTPGLSPGLPGLGQSLETALGRPEIRVAEEAIAMARRGREAAQAEFSPRIYMLASAGIVNGQNVQNGPTEGIGLHLTQGLFHGGQRVANMRSSDAEIHAAQASSRSILDQIGLEVTLAHHGATASKKRIDLAQPAVAQARENLRLLRVKYRNGNSTPTDLVDAESALTNAEQRYQAALYDFLLALARLDYAVGVVPETKAPSP